jgi:hypothetical protein
MLGPLVLNVSLSNFYKIFVADDGRYQLQNTNIGVGGSFYETGAW